LQGIPGVTAVTFASDVPMDFWRNAPTTYRRDDIQTDPIEARPAWAHIGYFRLLGIPLIDGRDFDSGDQSDSPRVAIVNQEAARRLWPGENPLGKTLVGDASYFFRRKWPRMTVVGVVGDIRDNGLRLAPQPIVWVPALQVHYSFGSVLVQSTRSADSLFPEIVNRIRALYPETTIDPLNYFSLDRLVRDSVWQLNYSVLLLAGLAGLALLVSSVGVYGVLSYTVRQRTREIGLRIALGAERSQVVGMILRQGLSIAVPGVIIGIVAAMGLTRFLGSLLYGVEPLDKLTFAFVAMVMMAAAFLASYLPARRATKVDPMATLRHE
jgi:putative ABC transport system permease protein